MLSGPNELRVGAMLSPAAASAVRPPGFRQHRGMRSFDAKSRRVYAWKAGVSRVNTSSSDVNANPLNEDADVVALVGAPGESGVIPASAVVPIPTSHLKLIFGRTDITSKTKFYNSPVCRRIIGLG